MGVRTNSSGGGEGLERLVASRDGGDWIFLFGNSLLKYGMMDEWMDG
jgi:hypothetical protein